MPVQISAPTSQVLDSVIFIENVSLHFLDCWTLRGHLEIFIISFLPVF